MSMAEHIFRDNDDESSKTCDETSILTDKSLRQPFYQLQKEQEQPVEKPSQFENIMADRIVIEESGASVESSYDNSKDILPFEFPIGRRDLQSHLNLPESNTEDKIGFNGLVDLKTGDLNYANIGRQQNVAGKSGISDTSTVDVANE